MSDLDKAVAKARELGSSTKLQLRWEGVGNAEHAAKLLMGLRAATYTARGGDINYHAVVNLYEKEGTAIAKKAAENLKAAHEGAWDTQTYEIAYGVNVTRASKELGQNAAHIIFIRNIMPTNDQGESLTNASATLNTIHTGAVRERANSLQGKGMIRIGMSGDPGLKASADKLKTGAKDLFNDFDALSEEARKKSLNLANGPNTLGKEDFDDSVDVMKNDGTPIKDLGGHVKKTYYITFQN